MPESDASDVVGAFEDSSSDASRRSSFTRRQEEALLADREQSSGAVEKRTVKIDQDWQDSYHAVPYRALKALVFFVALCIPAWILSSHSSSKLRPTVHSESGADAPLRVHPSQDYILDTNWDFSSVAKRREYHWVIEDKVLNPDGVYRPMMVINGAYPGPLIECNEGDTLVINVDNQAVNATSIHWHGIYQNGTNWMDGTVGVTQCPIAPGSTFKYEFTVDGQSGTYWYHAHFAAQASDGLAGPLIIHSKYEKTLQKLPYDTDRIIMIQDHYHDPSNKLLMEYLRPGRENSEPVPDGALLNGKNIRNCDAIANRTCDNSTASSLVIDLTPQTNHRLRFINIGAFAEFQIQIDEHSFAVTEVDGTDVEPAYYHRLKINPAQRYSIILSSNVTTAESFWLRARMITHCFAEKNPNLEPEIRAIVRYLDGGPLDVAMDSTSNLPTTEDWPEVIEVVCKDMNTTELIPVEVVAAPATVDSFFYLRSNFEIGAWQLSRGFFNKSSWRADVEYPTLLRAIHGFSAANESFSIKSSAEVNDRAFDMQRNLVLQTTGIQVIDLAIQNFDDGTHPFHLHGYKFFVLAQGQGGFDADTVYPTVDLSNPLRRDTASINPYGWILIRLVADNPGVWAFHCHVTWHTEAGLLMQFFTRSDIVATWDMPKDISDLCQSKGLRKGQAPEDELFYDEKYLGGS